MLTFVSRLFNKKELEEFQAKGEEEAKARGQEGEQAGASGHYAERQALKQDGGELEDGVKGMITNLTTQQADAALEVISSQLRLLASEPELGAETPKFGNYVARNCSEDPTYPSWEVFDTKLNASLGVKWDSLKGAVDYMQLLVAKDAKADYSLSLAAGLYRFSTRPAS